MKMGNTGGKLRGYTFTISVIFIAAVIIAAASFARERRRGQDASVAAVIQNSDALRMPSRIAAGLGTVLSVDAALGKNSTHTTLVLGGGFPLKKEGLPLADLHAYAEGLSSFARNRLNLEASLEAGALSSNGTVLLLPDSGSVFQNNNVSGYQDSITLVHPDAWAPSTITLDLYCSKYRSAIGNLSGAAQVGGTAVGYTVNFNDTNGTTSTSTLSVIANDNVTYSVSFSDGSNLTFRSNFSSYGSNTTMITFTKSPGAHAVLPFDDNVSSVGTGAVIDYSPYGHNMTLGGGSASFAPAWRSGALCHSGGCYHFDGSAQYLNTSNLNFTERTVEESQPELIANGGLDAFEGGLEPNPDDGATDNWASWTETGGAGNGVVFDATTASHGGSYAANISYDGGGGLAGDMLSQQISGLSTAAQYTLSFWTRGDGSNSGRYRVYDINTLNYLQNDGVTWNIDSSLRDTGISGTAYQQFSRSFRLDSGGLGNIRVEFIPTDIGGGATHYYVDDVSLKNTTGLNGGFEYYVDAASQDTFNNWAIKDSGGDAVFNAIAGVGSQHGGNVELNLQPGILPGSDANAYIYTTSLVLNNSSKYSLEFWAKGSGTTSVRYGIYDVTNTAYLDSDGSWNSGGTEVIFDSFVTGATYTKVVRSFRTLPSNVRQVQLRFYVPSSGSVYVDDASITEVKDFTISMWVQTYGTSTAVTPSLLYQAQATADGWSGLNWTVSGKNLTLYAAGSGILLAPNITIQDGNWHMLTFVANRSGNYSVYVDSSLISSANFSIGTINNTNGFLLGSRGGSNASFNGSIDEVRVYQRALSASDVYNHFRGKYQDSCRLNLTVGYSTASLLSRQLEADYNAKLRLRSMPPDALLAMPFDFNTSSSSRGMVIDYSPLAAHGTIGGDSSKLSWTAAGAFGGAYNFAAAGGYVRMPAFPDFGVNNFTVSFWVDEDPGDNEALLAKGSWQGSNGWSVYSASPVLARNWYWWNGASGVALGAPSSSWTHYAIVRNGTGSNQLAVYVNGVYSSSGTDSTNYSSGMPLTIGGSADSTPTNTLGGASIDELRMFNRSLNAEEIEALYRDYAKVYDGPVVASRD